jgi:hypothetical protein
MPGTRDLRAEATDPRRHSRVARTHSLTAVRSGDVVVGLFPGAVVARVKIVVVGEDA